MKTARGGRDLAATIATHATSPSGRHNHITQEKEKERPELGAFPAIPRRQQRRRNLPHQGFDCHGAMASIPSDPASQIWVDSRAMGRWSTSVAASPATACVQFNQVSQAERGAACYRSLIFRGSQAEVACAGGSTWSAGGGVMLWPRFLMGGGTGQPDEGPEPPEAQLQAKVHGMRPQRWSEESRTRSNTCTQPWQRHLPLR